MTEAEESEIMEAIEIGLKRPAHSRASNGHYNQTVCDIFRAIEPVIDNIMNKVAGDCIDASFNTMLNNMISRQRNN